MAGTLTPEVTAAVVRGAIVQVGLCASGGAIFYFTGEMLWVFGAALLGGVTMLLLVAQAGGFRTP